MASTLIEYAADLSYANDSSGMPPEQRCLAALRKLHNILASIKYGDKQLLGRLFDRVIAANSDILGAPFSFAVGNWSQTWDRDSNNMFTGADILDLSSAEPGRVIEGRPPEEAEIGWHEDDAYVDELALETGLDWAFDFADHI